MGIRNIHILVNNEAGPTLAQQAAAIKQERLIQEHSRGLHTYGNMRRECPLCK